MALKLNKWFKRHKSADGHPTSPTLIGGIPPQQTSHLPTLGLIRTTAPIKYHGVYYRDTTFTGELAKLTSCAFVSGDE
jgi:hypothetical protein